MSMNIKMIVTDLDGTLLRDDKTISAYSKDTLGRCRTAGIKIVYATGRGGSAEQVAPAELFDGKVTMNGAIARVRDRIVYNRLIPHLLARPLLLACDRRGLKTASELSGMHYSNFDVSDEWPGITAYQTVNFSLHDIDAEKLYAVVHSTEDADFIKSHLPQGLYLTVSRDGLAQVMHKEATKARAIAELARLWGISQHEILAFGDDLNDIDMLSYAGTGIAMAGAVDAVRAVADGTCLSCGEDGVAAWLMEHMLSSV